MTLLLAEGFDPRSAVTSGHWTPTGSGFANYAFVTGRLGGYAMRNTQSSLGVAVGFRKNIPESTTLVVGMALRQGTNYQGKDWAPLELMLSGTGVLHMAISSSTGYINVYRGAVLSAPVLLGTTSAVFPTDQVTWQYVELKVVAGTGTGGSVVVHQNGAETLSLTGVNTGSTSFSQIHFRNGQTNATGAYDNSTTGTFDDIYVCNDSGAVNNDFLGDVRVYGLWPSGNGTYSGMTGSDSDSVDNYLLVDDAAAGAPVTTDYVSSPVAGTKDTYAYTDVPSDVTVRGVQIDSYVSKSDAGPISGRAIAYDGTSTATGPDVVLSTSYVSSSIIMEKAPDGSGWSAAKLNAAQFGWEARD